MYEQLDLFSYVNLSKTEIPYLLTPGKEIYIVDKADVEKIIVDGERTWICGNSRYYRLRKEGGTYDVTSNDKIGERAFLDYEYARNKAYEYLRSHIDIILSEDIKPLSIVAYSYVRDCDNRTMTAFYCDLGDDMYYIKEFMTFHHICKNGKKKKENVIDKFMEQQEFKYENPQEIQGYVPHFKNMYKCAKPSDWLYAECGYAYAVG